MGCVVVEGQGGDRVWVSGVGAMVCAGLLEVVGIGAVLGVLVV